MLPHKLAVSNLDFSYSWLKHFLESNPHLLQLQLYLDNLSARILRCQRSVVAIPQYGKPNDQFVRGSTTTA